MCICSCYDILVAVSLSSSELVLEVSVKVNVSIGLGSGLGLPNGGIDLGLSCLATKVTMHFIAGCTNAREKLCLSLRKR